MSAKKDMRRTDLVIPYVEPKDEKSTDFGSTFSSTLPMAAMFTRNRLLGWVSVVMSLLNWLGESSSRRKANTTPGYLSFGMSLLAVFVTYMPLFLPPPPAVMAGGSGTAAAPPVPQ